MDDQDLINLQKLVGRAPQPSLLDPPPPEHELLARALLAHGGPLPPQPQPTPYQQALADALENFGMQGPKSPGNGGYPAGFSDTVFRPDSISDLPGGYLGPSGFPSQQLVSFSSPASQGGAPTAGQQSSDPGPQIAMGSPANVDLPWSQISDQFTPSPPRPAPPPTPAPPAPSNLQTTIDPIPGYDETGDNAWRASNDKIFLDAVNRYNAANGYRPGDPGYWTADMLKAQAMVESGGNKKAFQTDPLQVNTRANWDPVLKPRIAGLASADQVMTPDISADAALKWLNYKGRPRDDHGQPLPYIGDEGALRGYNGDSRPRSYFTHIPEDDGQAQRDWYASNIVGLAREAAALGARTTRRR